MALVAVESAPAQQVDSTAARILASGLSGRVLAQVDFCPTLPISRLKEVLKPLVCIDDTQRANIQDVQLMLVLDGAEPKATDTLVDLGIKAGDVVTFTALIYDVNKLARMEINQLHREALERSCRESQEQRALRARRREELVALRRVEVEREFADQQNQAPTGPMLMLTNQLDEKLAIADGAVGTARAPAKPVEPVPARKKDPLLAAAEVVAAYESFFDRISFRRGWDQPPFSLDDSRAAFISAAHIVTRARLEVLDARPGLKLRQVDGSARDWMHSPNLAQVLREDPTTFVKGLVHATFKDAKGYVEDLTEARVDQFILQYASPADKQKQYSAFLS